jgi:hypothetical protein
VQSERYALAAQNRFFKFFLNINDRKLSLWQNEIKILEILTIL